VFGIRSLVFLSYFLRLVFGLRSSVFGVWYLFICCLFWCLALGVQSLVSGPRSSLFGLRCLMFGLWCSVLGLQLRVFSFAFWVFGGWFVFINVYLLMYLVFGVMSGLRCSVFWCLVLGLRCILLLLLILLLFSIYLLLYWCLVFGVQSSVFGHCTSFIGNALLLNNGNDLLFHPPQ
jgi:hypothetical protein